MCSKTDETITNITTAVYILLSFFGTLVCVMIIESCWEQKKWHMVVHNRVKTTRDRLLFFFVRPLKVQIAEKFQEIVKITP